MRVILTFPASPYQNNQKRQNYRNPAGFRRKNRHNKIHKRTG